MIRQPINFGLLLVWCLKNSMAINLLCNNYIMFKLCISRSCIYELAGLLLEFRSTWIQVVSWIEFCSIYLLPSLGQQATWAMCLIATEAQVGTINTRGHYTSLFMSYMLTSHCPKQLTWPSPNYWAKEVHCSQTSVTTVSCYILSRPGHTAHSESLHLLFPLSKALFPHLPALLTPSGRWRLCSVRTSGHPLLKILPPCPLLTNLLHGVFIINWHTYVTYMFICKAT